jgi:hypothetical protein
MTKKVSLSEIRSRIHDKSHDYFVFEYRRWDRAKRDMFYGATDALYDASLASDSYGRAITKDQGANLLVCYGFLQSLYIQQDAVWTLSRALELTWHPNDSHRLREIRNVRNRLTGHPALGGEKEKPRRLSSAIISSDSITPCGFQATIYYEDGFKNVFVDVSTYLGDNEKQLIAQLRAVEKKMDAEERKFRRKRANPPMSDVFSGSFDYLLQRLWCGLNDQDRLLQAKAHAKIIREEILSLRKDIEKRELNSEQMAHCFDRIFRGIQRLEKIMNKKSFSANDHCDFDLVYEGTKSQIRKLKKIVRDLDEKLSTLV